MARRPGPRLAALAALLALALPVPARAEDAPPAVSTEVQGALQALRSPAERTRRAATRRLVDLLPRSRPPVLQALPGAPAFVKLLLVEVLLADRSPVAVRAVLEELERSDDVLATQILQTLLRAPDAGASVQAAWERHPELKVDAAGQLRPRARDLERLLARAEAERLFISRKSNTGSTGSYRGQYDVLLSHREVAIELCMALIMDRALPVPGVHAAGGFRFLRPPRTPIDLDEQRSMAAHAFSELARPTDTRQILELTRFLRQLEQRIDELELYSDRVEFLDALTRYSDLLVALYLVRPDRFESLLDSFLTKLQSDYNWNTALSPTYRALVLLRVGRHDDAVREFEWALRYGEVRSRAATHYNLACAYAQWGELFSGRERAEKQEVALYHLEQAVRNRWSDIGWMEEDRDLDPIRDSSTYKRLLEEVRRELRIPGGD